MNFTIQGGNRNVDSFKSAKHHPGADNTAAVVTLAAVANKRNVVHGVTWSYNKLTPAAAGGISITNGGTVVNGFDIVQGGPGSLPLSVVGSVNAAVVVTLAAISDSQGKLNVDYTVE